MQVGKGAPPLLEPQAVAGEQLVGNREADEPERELVDEAAVGAVEERDRRDARRLAERERATEEVEGQSRVHNVLDQEYVSTREWSVDVLQQPHAAALAVRVRRELDDVE